MKNQETGNYKGCPWEIWEGEVSWVVKVTIKGRAVYSSAYSRAGAINEAKELIDTLK